MKLFKRQQSDTTVPPALQPYYEPTQPRWRQILWLVVRWAILVAVIVLIVWGIIWAYHKVTNHHAEPRPQVQQSPQSNDMPKQKDNPAKTPASGSTNNQPVQTPAPSETLPNTGG